MEQKNTSFTCFGAFILALDLLLLLAINNNNNKNMNIIVLYSLDDFENQHYFTRLGNTRWRKKENLLYRVKVPGRGCRRVV